jgi:hypothetical protein
MHLIDFRLSGTSENLDNWIVFLRAVERKELISILEVSKYYPNTRNDSQSKVMRCYIKINLNVEVT